LGGTSKDALTLGSDVPDRMAEVRDEVVSQGPGLEQMAYLPIAKPTMSPITTTRMRLVTTPATRPPTATTSATVCNALLTGFS